MGLSLSPPIPPSLIFSCTESMRDSVQHLPPKGPTATSAGLARNKTLQFL